MLIIKLDQTDSVTDNNILIISIIKTLYLYEIGRTYKE